jgi:hypothetical protein
MDRGCRPDETDGGDGEGRGKTGQTLPTAIPRPSLSFPVSPYPPPSAPGSGRDVHLKTLRGDEVPKQQVVGRRRAEQRQTVEQLRRPQPWTGTQDRLAKGMNTVAARRPRFRKTVVRSRVRTSRNRPSENASKRVVFNGRPEASGRPRARAASVCARSRRRTRSAPLSSRRRGDRGR